MKRSDKAIAQLRWAKAKYHREARVWDEQMAEVTQRVSQLEQENQILEENIAHSSYHATLLEQANENMIEKNDNQRATITDLQHRLNDSLMEWQIVTAERETLAKDNAQLRAKLTDQNKVIDHLYEKNDELVRKYAIAEADVKTARAGLDVLEGIRLLLVDAGIAGWGDDDDLTYLEQLLDTYQTNTEDLAGRLNNIRTQR